MARELGFGGSERQMTQTALALRGTGFEPTIGCFVSEGVRGAELRDAGVPVVQFPVHSFGSFTALREARRLVRFIRRERIAVVHTWDYPLGIFAAPLARFFTTAAVVTSQRGHRSLTPVLHRNLVQCTDSFADGIVVNCEFLRDHLINDYAIAPHRLHLCYNGVDTGRFMAGQPLRPPGISAESLVIGTVCALRPEKNIETLIEAFALLRRRRQRLKLVVVGSGPESSRLEQFARDACVASDCLFQPGVSEVTDWLRLMDVFVLPSRTEALSNSLMEAMASGCACAASSVGGNPELIEDGETGILFPPGDAQALAAALGRLLDDAALRARLVARAVRTVQMRFSAEKAANRMAEIYTEILDYRRLLMS